jgi:hypothetical protein
MLINTDLRLDECEEITIGIIQRYHITESVLKKLKGFYETNLTKSKKEANDTSAKLISDFQVA